MSKMVDVHWLLKKEPTREARHLCEVSRAAQEAEHPVVLRPVIRQFQSTQSRIAIEKCNSSSSQRLTSTVVPHAEINSHLNKLIDREAKVTRCKVTRWRMEER